MNAITSDNWDDVSDEDIDQSVQEISGLLTKEAAVNNPQVIKQINEDSYPKHMKTALAKVEGQLKPIMDKVGVDYSDAQFISDKIEDLNAAIDKATSTGESKEVIETLNKEIREAKEQLASMPEEYKKREQEIHSQYKARELKNAYKLKVKSEQWADVYADQMIQDAIIDKQWDKLNAKAHLELSDDGDILVRNKEMPEKELYDGNNKIVTFQSLYKPEIEKFLKKSEPKKETRRPEPVLVTSPPTTNAERMAARKAEF